MLFFFNVNYPQQIHAQPRRCGGARVRVPVGVFVCARGQLIWEDDAGGQSFDSYSARMRKEE